MNDNRVLNMAKSCIQDLTNMFKRLDEANEAGKVEEVENLEQEIDEQDYGTSVQKTYSITLAGGGPAMRVFGDLDEHNQPETAELQYQDWGTPWTKLPVSGEQEDLLLRYASRKYFGE